VRHEGHHPTRRTPVRPDRRRLDETRRLEELAPPRFNATTEAIGLGRPRPYDLRHSFASLMIRDGNTSIVELAEQLGHSPTETLKTYAHVFAEHRRQPRVPASELIQAARAR
jgi:integrase